MEEAVQLIERHGGEATVLTLGPVEAEEQLRYAASLGVAKAVLLPIDGADWDPQRTAAAIAAAIRDIEASDGTFDIIRTRVLAYVQDELIAHEMNAFDAALALIALGHLGAPPASFAPALHCIVASLGEGGRHGPFKAYEWNKMKTPTRILVGGPEVTSAFVLMGLALARRATMVAK